MLQVEKYGSFVLMSELWICREQTAKTAFWTEYPEMEIWNIEEMCYYLYQNIEQIDEGTINETFFSWLEKELLMQELASEVSKQFKQGKSTLWCAWFILKEVGMYTEEELGEIRTYCLAMENKDAFECQKLKADRSLMNKKYFRSIQEYYRLLSMGESGKQSLRLLGDIWHNLGVAHARLFLFEEAADYFAKAYELNKNEETFLAQQEALRMMKAQPEIQVETVSSECIDWNRSLEKLREDYKKKVM